MKFLKGLGILLFVLIVIYFLGPSPSYPKYDLKLPDVPAEPAALEKYVSGEESIHKLKPDNQARIQWFNDSTKVPTEFAVVYIHGFSASQGDGNPVHLDFAKKFGCNLFLDRLEDHGVDTTEPLSFVTADRLWNSAKDAYAIGRRLGKKVILMATSTGGTLALKLAAEYPEIAGLILLSPNVAINDSKAWLLNNHWGFQIAKIVKGKHIIAEDTSAIYKQYWNQEYDIASTVQLEELIETTMKESVFKRVKQPLLLLYYYKDPDHQDPVVKVSAMKRMFLQLGTAGNLKKQVAIPTAGTHVIGSFIKSKDLASVETEINKFGIEILHLKAMGE